MFVWWESVIFYAAKRNFMSVRQGKRCGFSKKISGCFSNGSAYRKKHMACRKKYKPYILKHKALILKYVPCIFEENKYLNDNNLQKQEDLL